MNDVTYGKITYFDYLKSLSYMKKKFPGLKLVSFGKTASGESIPALVFGRGNRRIVQFADFSDTEAVLRVLRFCETLLTAEKNGEKLCGIDAGSILDEVSVAFVAAYGLKQKTIFKKTCSVISFSAFHEFSSGADEVHFYGEEGSFEKILFCAGVYSGAGGALLVSGSEEKCMASEIAALCSVPAFRLISDKQHAFDENTLRTMLAALIV